jgi:hypothetical protein
MSNTTESNLNEMMAGDGSGLAMPPAFVFVNTKKRRTYGKKGNDSVDGRTKGAKSMLSRITNRKKMKEQVEETIISEAVPSETERAQKQIQQGKKLGRQKDMQKKKKEAKEKMQSKTSEMDVLMKARLSDFKKKASDQQKKVQKNSFEMTGNTMIRENTDTLDVALQVATQELNPAGETSFAKIDFSDGTTQNLDNFSAKRIAACYAQLDEPKQQQFRYMLNKDATTYQSALDFAVRNV